MHRPMSPEEASRRRALDVLDALRVAIEEGATVLVEERPPRGVYPSNASDRYRRCVTFQVDALAYDSAFRLPG
jgi:hypothetical protein